jgi:hypothetical protein
MTSDFLEGHAMVPNIVYEIAAPPAVNWAVRNNRQKCKMNITQNKDVLQLCNSQKND